MALAVSFPRVHRMHRRIPCCGSLPQAAAPTSHVFCPHSAGDFLTDIDRLGMVIGKAIEKVVVPLKTLIDNFIASQTSADEVSSAMTDDAYEAHVRSLLPGQLLQRCGLEVVRGVDFNRPAFLEREWDFRAPVTVAHTAPHSNAVPGSFEVFPSKPCYIRPPSITAKNVTPTKVGLGAPPSAEYLALFELTTTARWTRAHKLSAKPGLLERLEVRLRLSLDRAKDLGIVTAEQDITHLVAVVGVVAPTPYTRSVMDMMASSSAPLLLKTMMDAGRFVFFAVPRLGSPAHR